MGSVATETSPLSGGSGLAALSASAEWDGRDLFVSTPSCPRAQEEGRSVANASERRGLPEGPTSRGWWQHPSSPKGGEKLVRGGDVGEGVVGAGVVRDGDVQDGVVRDVVVWDGTGLSGMGVVREWDVRDGGV